MFLRDRQTGSDQSGQLSSGRRISGKRRQHALRNERRGPVRCVLFARDESRRRGTERPRDVFIYRSSGEPRAGQRRQGGARLNRSSSRPRSARRPICGALSYASNLVENDMNGSADTFLKDRRTGLTSRVSVDQQRCQHARESTGPSDQRGRPFVVFGSSRVQSRSRRTTMTLDLFVRDH